VEYSRSQDYLRGELPDVCAIHAEYYPLWGVFSFLVGPLLSSDLSCRRFFLVAVYIARRIWTMECVDGHQINYIIPRLSALAVDRLIRRSQSS
jgi:hypothetical protein